MAKPYQYKGVLAEPAKRPLLREAQKNPDDEELAGRARQEGLTAYLERIYALHEDCGVSPRDPKAWETIALTLASRHIPGFKRSGRGAPRWSWSKLTKDYLVFSAMSSRVNDGGQSVRQASQYVARKWPDLGDKSAVATRYRRVLAQIEEEPGYRDRLWMLVEWSIATKLKKMLQNGGLSEEQHKIVEKLLPILENDKDAEVRRSWLTAIMGIDWLQQKLE